MSDLDNEFDFGFSFDDEAPIVKATPQPKQNNEQLDDLLLDAQEKQVESAYIAAIETQYKAKLKEVEGLILPLLYNLMKNPEKPIINWPNRETVIKKQIDKIIALTRG